ncbi:MAG: hypothetical protein ACFFCW_32190, partial [Candidatus Hodarchaeota archaeon]
ARCCNFAKRRSELVNLPLQKAVTLLNPYPADLMRTYTVSPPVNSPSKVDPAVIRPIKRRKKRVIYIADSKLFNEILYSYGATFLMKPTKYFF